MQALVARAAGTLTSAAIGSVASSSLRASAGFALKRSVATQPKPHFGGSEKWDQLRYTAKGKRDEGPPEDRWEKRSGSVVASLLPPNNAYAGRSVEVMNGDITEALRQLQVTLMRNKVQQELRMSARHEKKGVKRRRLRSQRWRRRFAHEVRKKVQLVNAIRARGA